MIPIIGYSANRVKPVEDSPADDFGQWVHAHNFRAVKSAANSQSTGNNTGNDTNNRQQVPFAVLLKQAEQDNSRPQQVELRPRANQFFGELDIIA